MNNNTPALPPDSVERMMQAAAQLFRVVPKGHLTGMEAAALQALCLALYFKIELCSADYHGWPDGLRQALSAAIWQHLDELADVAGEPPEGLAFCAWYCAARADALQRDDWPDVIGA